MLAGPIACQIFGEDILDEDVVWFVDNTSALTSLIKGSSPVEDNNEMALFAASALTSMNVRCWFEHVDSEANPADPLSRDGFSDALVQAWVQQGWLHLREAAVDWAAISCSW